MELPMRCIFLLSKSNMKYFSLWMMLITSVIASAQTERPVDSRITNVTVFLSSAQVTREVKTRIEGGKATLVVSGLTAYLDPNSIQVSGKGNLMILGVSHRQNYLNEFNVPKPLQLLRDSIERLRNGVALENAQKEILGREEQLILTNQKIGGANQNLTVAELKAMADFFRSRLSEIVSAKMKVDEKIKRMNERMVKVQQQINEQNELYSRNTSEIVISVSADAATNVDLDVNYVVANAGWLPNYDIRAINSKSPIQLSYKANVFQSTGEEWKNVRMKLSTANPNLGGVKPELFTWNIDFYREMYRALQGRIAGVNTSKRKSAPAVEGYVSAPMEEDKMEEVTSVADAVQTIQTTLNTEFDIALPYTVSSSNKPTLVDIRNLEVKADFQYAATPKLDGDAFLMARATGWEDFSLLPGEANVFFEGTFVAKTYVDPNNIRDTLNISLGRDKRIVVKREKLKDFSSKKFIGTNQKESFAYEISVRNTKSEVIKIVVEDQIPVSNNSQIEVTAEELGGAKYDKITGKLTWEVTLQPNETKKVKFAFGVKYPKNEVLSGL